MNNFSYEYYRDNQKRALCWKSVNDNCLPHFHSSIEIIYVTSGEIKATLNGQVYSVKANSFLIVPSYTIHIYTTEVSSLSYVLTIPLDTIPSYKVAFLKKTFSTLLIESPYYADELIHCLDALCDLSRDYIYIRPRPEDIPIDDCMMNGLACCMVNLDPPSILHSPMEENIVKGYTYVFLGLLIGQVGLIDIPNTKITSLAQEILIYLQNNYQQVISLEDIAAHFGYSKSRFSHIFNEYFGCKLIEYINGLRCRYALELLEEKNTTVTEIALASGFDSTRTFYRAFRKCFGCTPNQYLLK